MTRDDCLALDAADPLAPLREQFALPERVIYLDGNSLGVLPRATPARVAEVVADEWGQGLIRSWNDAGWITLAQRVGDKIARLVGAGPGELVVADSTSVNLYKVLSAALAASAAQHPGRTVILSERGNFPTDLYIAQSLARQHRLDLQLVPSEALMASLDEHVAVVMLTEVNYRSGRLHDMAALTAHAHEVGALTVWDLAHSAGAVPVNLTAADADFAIGCGYKYLNGGPGAPAFVWVNPHHADTAWQPLSGWLGHAAPFDFDGGYRPAPGTTRFLCGTPPVISLAALECGVDTVLAAEPLGGLPALRRKSLALGRLFIDAVQTRCAGHGLRLASPHDDALRGSQVSLAMTEGDGDGDGDGDGEREGEGESEGAYAVMQALIARGVIGDFRAGTHAAAPTHADPGDVDLTAVDLLRFGFTPLYTRFVDVWDAAEQLGQVLDSGEWRSERFQRRGGVT